MLLSSPFVRSGLPCVVLLLLLGGWPATPSRLSGWPATPSRIWGEDRDPVAGHLPGRSVRGDVYPVGVSRVDITPRYPVRLSGFGFRRTESEGVRQRIWASALAVGQAD